MEQKAVRPRREAREAQAALDERSQAELKAVLTRLQSDWPPTHKKAVQALHEFGEQAIEPLCNALQNRDKSVRAAAAEALGHVGDGDAVVPLCNALQDRDARVRTAAVEALGCIGDERAVQPLILALRRCLIGGSGRRTRMIGLGMLFATALFIAGVLFGLDALRTGGILFYGMQIVAMIISNYFLARFESSSLCHPITEALERIAERHPTLALRAALPDLQAISADTLQYTRTRKASSRAAQRIEALTAKLKELPVPSAPPAPDAASLPRPAEAPQPDSSRLPRIGS